ncbi:helix-turn-helix domain-containing protein [Spiractinospora alimapuensis]|uniref:GlxA family transcriptional regulator n=1 Tax=Spiractinospora alimapuensis TaxID=2820884 RepID=UPI001F16AA1F|nr:helix-turn-helix domain-containing protein [Spiractinospora alimapuensis]QVQ54332.1 helix-turn-helix domain-containing protein [Spiractinospora alimapuensis]
MADDRNGRGERPEGTPHRVVVLLLPPVVGFDATIPPLIFGSAVDQDGRRLYDVSVCSVGGTPAHTASDYVLTPGSGLDALAGADSVVVPGTKRESVYRQGTMDPETAAAVALIPEDARVISLCTGAFALAAAGYLAGRRATTHWNHASRFREHYPDVDLDETALFVDEGSVLTSAGLTAGIDLCLHVVRRDAGWEAANRVARHCVAPSWRDGDQAQYIELPRPTGTGSSTAASRAWALERLGTRITVPEWAAQAHMSVRSFSRRFRAETGISPGTWLTQQRIRRAQELLESTDLAVEAIAEKVGIGTGAALRKQLRAVAGTTPSAHRRRFAKDRPSPVGGGRARAS